MRLPFHRLSFIACSLVILVTLLSCGPIKKASTVSGDWPVEQYTTSGDKRFLLQHYAGRLPLVGDPGPNAVISVDTARKFQEIDGFGYTLTGGSAFLINHLPAMQRGVLLNELFGSGTDGIGISFLRISIGASDLDTAVFSYNDLPPGKTDTALTAFSLAPDEANLLPVLRSVLKINPNIKLLATPWSAPAWMKTNDSTAGGQLADHYLDVYTKYLIRYLIEMKKTGIPVHAITLQNEPLNAHNNPSMVMPPAQQGSLVKRLGPALAAAGLNTRIILYDHNCDRPDYPIKILQDEEARRYIDGTAFHLYAGEITAMGEVHRMYPDKNLYFTEQYTGTNGSFAGDLDWHMRNVMIGALQNYSRTVLEWNLANDPLYGPFTPGGCNTCLGALTIGDSITRNVSYYIIAQASKLILPGSIRVATKPVDNLNHVAFQRPDGKRVVMLHNESDQPISFSISVDRKFISAAVPPHAASTLLW